MASPGTESPAGAASAATGAASSGAPLLKDGSRRPLTYAELCKDSLRAVSMENGLQYSAIYWETGHRTWLPFWASFTQKFTWKLIDDQVK